MRRIIGKPWENLRNTLGKHKDLREIIRKPKANEWRTSRKFK